MRSFGSLLILILIGITILVVSGRNTAVTVSHAKLTDDVRSYDSIVRLRYPILREPIRNTNDFPTTPIVEVVPEPVIASDEFSSPVQMYEPRIIEVEEDQDESKERKEFERLIIPSLKVNGKIHAIPYTELSWDISTLGQDIAFLDDIPGQMTDNNIVFAAHITVRNGSNGPFRNLRKINPGEKIILKDEDFNYNYIVREKKLVYPEESSVLADTSHRQLTLITCHTWDEETLSYLRRLVVFADLEKVEPRQDLRDNSPLN